MASIIKKGGKKNAQRLKFPFSSRCKFHAAAANNSEIHNTKLLTRGSVFSQLPGRSQRKNEQRNNAQRQLLFHGDLCMRFAISEQAEALLVHFLPAPSLTRFASRTAQSINLRPQSAAILYLEWCSTAQIWELAAKRDWNKAQLIKIASAI